MKTKIKENLKSAMECMKACWKNHRDTMKSKRLNRKYDELMKESERVIQVREWDGELYLSVNNQPLLTVDFLAEKDLAVAVDGARNAWLEYQLRHGA